jgi:ubiquinone/menaquinone biosynthesis C-methylase UbiE
MSLQTKDIPLFISPPHLCTPSRIVGEKRLAAVLREIKGAEIIATVLDVGCGGGEYRFLFPGCVYAGIDITDCRFAEKVCEKHHFLIGDAVYLPVRSNSQDMVYSSYAFEYFPDAKQALREIYRVLRPGGMAVLCLPTKWVVVYDVLSDLLRRAGINIGQVSAQPGISYYDPATMQDLAKKTSFATAQIIPVYGWPVLLLKAVSSWYRVVLHMLARLIRKLSKGKVGKNAPPLYVSRRVASARSYQEWQETLGKELATCSSIGQTYLLLVEFAGKLDNFIGSRPIVEYIMLLSKPMNTGKV